MKFKKCLGALAILLALTTVACNGGGQPSESGNKPTSSAQQSTSALPAIKVTAADNKKTLEVDETVQLTADVEGVTWESSAVAVATVDDKGLVTAVGAGSAKISAKKDGYKAGEISITVNKPANPLWTPLPRTYTDGEPAQNSAGKEYIPLNDATANKVGVKIAIQNYEVAEGATATSSLSSDGKIGPVNDHKAALAWKIKAPKAGNYQLVMVGKCKSDAAEYTLAERAFGVKLNGAEVNVDAEERIAVTTESAPFVAAPTIALSGPETEDVIAITCTDYRIQFDTSSFLLFQEI
ncbi:MAG: Ig-like domain-containing protein [Bacilli bacterium]|nr:Ig-like domain-containing protein [Bacilli bacterium]